MTAAPRSTPATSGDEQMMRLVAELYYIRDQSQSSIADLTGYSISKVSRLLAQAREVGIVRISVQAAPEQLSGLAERLAEGLGIDDAHVTPGRSDAPSIASRLCAVAAAPWVEGTVPDAGVLGIAGGFTVSALVDAFPPARRGHLTVVPLVGGFDPGAPHLDINEVTRRAAERLGAHYLVLHAPARVDSPAVRDALMRESSILATTEYWSRLSLAIIGISGGPLAHPGYWTVMDRLTPEDRGRLLDNHVVGDIVGHLFTEDGALVEDPSTDQTIAAPVETLRHAARVIAVAAGPHKVAGIIGASRTGLLDSLVTDEPTALAILERLAASPRRRPRGARSAREVARGRPAGS